MPKRTPNPLDELRKDVLKHGKDIVALKARLVDAEQRLAKAETALGAVAKGSMPPNVEQQTTREEQQPETE
ncbi:MAG TPA: hypothetical protein VGI97_00700 [Gemmatimonadaceae bacterium]